MEAVMINTKRSSISITLTNLSPSITLSQILHFLFPHLNIPTTVSFFLLAQLSSPCLVICSACSRTRGSLCFFPHLKIIKRGFPLKYHYQRLVKWFFTESGRLYQFFSSSVRDFGCFVIGFSTWKLKS